MSKNAWKIVVIAGPFAGKETTLSATAGELRIGRGPTHGLSFFEVLGSQTKEDRQVSRDHGILRVLPNGLEFVDTNSANGTFRNNERLPSDKPVRLKHGDELSLGPESIIRVLRLETHETAETPRRHRPVAPAAPAASPSAKEKPHETFGNFLVFDKVGASDSDTVHRAEEKTTHREVALKRFVANRALTSAARGRVREQAQAAAKWKHANIAEILACDEHDGTLYLTRRFVPGAGLAVLFDAAARHIDVALAVYIVRAACAAFGYAQSVQRDFVQRYFGHRNIVLGHDGSVAVINFGMAPVDKLLQPDAKLAAADNRFLAHQVEVNRDVDCRADVFSLGVVLYELLAQRAIDPRMRNMLRGIDAVNPEAGMPRSLSDTVNKSVMFNVARRISSPAELGELLGSALKEVSPGFGAKQAAAWMEKYGR